MGPTLKLCNNMVSNRECECVVFHPPLRYFSEMLHIFKFSGIKEHSENNFLIIDIVRFEVIVL